ncbi:unnamed protein product [Schistocephalus solidus]|uniref:Arp2/3 complex 34 kDa subunit n=1 Tax=Schistocephalus solidus TaxID=70667 RepID=A0A183SYZ9_SCHSO|nr:unnamed protein product [Schistocephalus solidus]
MCEYLLQTFRIVKGLDFCLELSDFFEFAATTHLRGQQLQLRVQQTRLGVRMFSFSIRVVKSWNALAVDVVMSPSLESFKRDLDSFMLPNEPEYEEFNFTLETHATLVIFYDNL